MVADLQVVEKESSNPLAESKLPDGFSIDISKWLMKEHIEWTQAANSGNGPELNRLMASAIRKWPHLKQCGSPEKVESYLKLEPKQWKACLSAMGVEVNNAFLD